jgi:GTPase SAR1 family protein
MSEIKQLVEYLATARVNALQVMSVWGIAGVGKSALVRNLYHNKQNHKEEDSNNAYKKCIWVDIHHPFNLTDFCKSLLTQFHSRSPKANEDPVKECHGLLKDNWCLLVIDNLQSTEEWDLIHDALAFRSSGSAIIVITNEERIALHCADRKDLVFNVKALEIRAAVDLFKKEVRLHKDNVDYYSYFTVLHHTKLNITHRCMITVLLFTALDKK